MLPNALNSKRFFFSQCNTKKKRKRLDEFHMWLWEILDAKILEFLICNIASVKTGSWSNIKWTSRSFMAFLSLDPSSCWWSMAKLSALIIWLAVNVVATASWAEHHTRERYSRFVAAETMRVIDKANLAFLRGIWRETSIQNKGNKKYRWPFE